MDLKHVKYIRIFCVIDSNEFILIFFTNIVQLKKLHNKIVWDSCKKIEQNNLAQNKIQIQIIYKDRDFQ